MRRAQIYLKREDLNHTGAHKINNTLGQALLTRADGQAARDRRDRRRPARRGHRHRLRPVRPRVRRLHGRGGHPPAEAQRVQHAAAGRRGRGRSTSGSRTLRDAINEAMRDWMASVETTHYILGSVVGPHPFPLIVRDFQSVIGRETRRQCLEQLGRLPDVVVACVGGGSNAAGMFYPFVDDDEVALVGVEAGGRSEQPGDHAATLSLRPARRAARQLQLRAAGRRRPDRRRALRLGRARLSRRGPGAQLLEGAGRVEYTSVTDAEALDAFDLWPAAKASCPPWKAPTPWPGPSREAARRPADEIIVVCLSGRGDKDAAEIARLRGLTSEEVRPDGRQPSPGSRGWKPEEPGDFAPGRRHHHPHRGERSQRRRLSPPATPQTPNRLAE